jgi:sugar O-acyltransferase (sialic acid O-acetyltransferase NeuD family)
VADRAAIIWGSAGHARVLRDILYEQGDRIVAFIDRETTVRAVVPGVPLFRDEEMLSAFIADQNERSLDGYVAIGGPHGETRRQILKIFHGLGLSTPALIHSNAFIAASAQIGEGSQALANSMLAADATVGRGTILNHGTNVDHECQIADGVHIAPGATLCGCVRVDDDVFIGAGATILPRLHIGAGAVIAAGATVIRDVAPGHIVFGTPAGPRP